MNSPIRMLHRRGDWVIQPSRADDVHLNAPIAQLVEQLICNQ